MKYFFIAFLFCSSTFLFGANVYFNSPSNNSTFEVGVNGRAGISYDLLTVSLFFITDWYGARIQKPDGQWTSWQDGQSGGWVFEKAGTYYIQGCVHVKYDMGGYSNYFMYSNIITVYIIDNIAPTIPQNLGMSSNSGQYGNVRLDWSANSESDISHYEVWNFFDEESDWRGWEMIGTTTSNYFIDALVFYAPNAGNYHGHYKIKAVDINGNYSDFSSEVTERVEPTWNILYDSPQIVSQGLLVMGKETPKEYSISTYPNPFNPTTKIKYQLKFDGMASIIVYDILGKVVATLVNEYKESGTHEVSFNASTLPSGVYLLRIESNRFVQTKKLLLMK